ncbi:hypothetical protein ACIQ6Y_19290 [Streptomyces sp. NPDC096205]|uniref:hypothetical protein n=1 Tax=Streptomyces sp. NPDC096205 TaxID=3366081 RepID=UPI00382C2472
MLKPAQLQLAAQLGLTVPPTLVTNDVEAARTFAADHGPVIYKTFRGLPRDEDGTSPRSGPSASAPTPSTTPSR